jgi:hypothetical protein
MQRRSNRKTRLAVETLEDRQLLNAKTLVHGKLVDNKDLNRVETQIHNATSLADRRLSYTTPAGTKVIVTLYGLGTLAGSNVDADGALNLVYDNTNGSSQITAFTTGGNGRAALRTIRDADTAIGDFSGVGANQVGAVVMSNFDLVDGGKINLAGGVALLRLNSIGANTQVELRSLPIPSSTTLPAETPVETLQFVTTPGGGSELAGFGGLTFPGAASGTATTGSTGTGGLALPGAATNVPASLKAPPVGVRLLVNQINGTPRNGPPLGNAQVFGYDPTTNTLDRFDAVTGSLLQSIAVPLPANPVAGVGLSRDHGHLVALIGLGQTVLAYDVVTGAAVGQFSIANLAPTLNRVDGIALTDTRTVFTDASSGSAGMAQEIDVTASLASGQAVAIGAPFSPARELHLLGGGTGVAGSPFAYLAAAAHFDTAQPENFERGVLTASTGGTIREVSRTALPSPPSLIQAGPPLPGPEALGSVDQNLALVTGTYGGQNSVSLYSPVNLSAQGSIALDDPNLLASLSQSFHPELGGTALINVRGILNRINADRVTGLVVDDIGFLNFIEIGKATDSAFVGMPVNHVLIGQRSNVSILSTFRPVDGRGGVTINESLKPLGPFTQP